MCRSSVGEDDDGKALSTLTKYAKPMITVHSNSGLENPIKAVIANFPHINLIKVGAGSEDEAIKPYTIVYIFGDLYPQHKEMQQQGIKDK